MPDPSMRLLHVIHSLDPDTGGPPEHLLQLARGYREAAIALEVLCLDSSEAPFLTRYPFVIHAFGPTTSTFGYNAAAARWMHANLSSFDAVIVDGLWQYPGIAARKYARDAHVPYFVFPHGMLDPWFRQTYPLKHIKKQLFWWAGQYRVLRDAERVIFTTEAEQEIAPQTFWPHAWRSAVVPLGTNRPDGDADQQREAFYERCPRVRGRRFFLFLSRIHEKKGCDLLLKAFGSIASQHTEIDLVLAGPDTAGLKAGLETIARDGGFADRVHWPGMLQGDAKWGAFRAAEAFVLPSHQENFGIAVAEAIACRVPVLISDKINIWKYVTEDGTGFVEEDTEDGTRRLLLSWLHLNKEQRAAIAARTDASFEKRFSMWTCAERIRILVEQARGRESRSSPAARGKL